MQNRILMEEVFELVSDARQLAPFRAKLRTVLLKMGLKEKSIAELVLAVDEAMTNSIRHAYAGKEGKIKVVVFDRADRIEISIEDSGRKFDPTKIPPPELPPKKPGGLGLYFIKILTDNAAYDSEYAGGNRLRLTKCK